MSPPGKQYFFQSPLFGRTKDTEIERERERVTGEQKLGDKHQFVSESSETETVWCGGFASRSPEPLDVIRVNN